jgi:glyoxylase-like metal-dependent hydrolase (beta-lactamase superfamily II)
MSPFRAAAAARELARSSPLLALEMQRNRAQVARIADVKIGKVTYPAVRYAAGGYGFIALFDPMTGLPARIRTRDFDSIQGDASFDLVLSDWRAVGGIQVAHHQVYELDGIVVVDATYESVELNPAIEAARFEIPEAYRADALGANAPVPYQWVIRRQYAGTFFDADRVSYDSKSSKGLELVELAPGVQIVQGGTHNSLIVELADHLVVFDAPISDAQSQWTIHAAQARFPGKPIRHLVLTHHHIDHSAGLRSYAAAGASLIVGAGTSAHYRELLTAPSTRNPDLPAAQLAATPISEVADRLLLGDGERELGVYRVDNPHAQGMLIGYIADAKLGFVTDLWSPGRDPLPEQSNPLLAAVVEAVNQYQLAPERFAGGHGNSAPYEPLAKLVGGCAGD